MNISWIKYYLLNINSDLDLEGHPIKGNSWEGFVIEQILQHVGSNYQAFFYRTHQGAELDLILTKSLRPVFAIEIKYSSSPNLTKGNLIAFEDIQAEHNFIITPDSEDYQISRTTRVCSLPDFLRSQI